MLVELKGTPTSLSGAPAWVSSKAEASPRPAVSVAPSASTLASSKTPSPPSLAMAQDPQTGCRVWKPSLMPNDAVTWSGACVNGLADGPGTAQWTADGKNTLTYEGTFRYGLIEGEGKMIAVGGDRYEGHYRDGKRDGHGVYSSNTGERYDGEFKDNKRHGRGTLTSADGGHLEGIFLDGKLPAELAPQPPPAIAVAPMPGATVTPTPDPVEVRRTIKDICSGGNLISEQVCRVHECSKAEHGSDPICVRLKENEERRQQQQR